MGRSIIDNDLNEADVALPTADGTSYSADIDLGADAYKGENFELLVTVPDLTTTHLPDADTLTINLVSGAAAAPTTVKQSIGTLTGAGGAGTSGPDTFRVRVPSNVERYIRVQFVAAGGTGDMSAVDATVGLRF